MPVKLLDGVPAECQRTERHHFQQIPCEYEPMTHMEMLFHISTAVAAFGICLFCYLSLPFYEDPPQGEGLFQKEKDNF